jgi:signal transduction histidine kinase
MSIAAASNPAPRCQGVGNGHPLEIIPVFRRFRRSVARDIIYTALWNALFALFFALLAILFAPDEPIALVLRDTFVYAQCIGFVIYGAYLVAGRLFAAQLHDAGLWVRSAFHALIAIVGIFPGYLLAFRILHLTHGSSWLFSPRTVVSIVIVTLLITAILLLIFVPRERAARAEASIAREQARVAAAENEATTARMKLLEAQVEPHFLYNTLAHVICLIDEEPHTAKGMIERLIALLRASAASATGKATLGAQVALLRAYLEIVALRMGTRLRWRIDVPAMLCDVAAPPMLLQPIVENAVRHGLEPSLDGGEIVIAARRNGSLLVLTVVDTGVGFRATASHETPGIGLANLRARLVTLFGDAAGVTIEDVQPHGTRVSVALPVAYTRRASSSADAPARAMPVGSQ